MSANRNTHRVKAAWALMGMDQWNEMHLYKRVISAIYKQTRRVESCNSSLGLQPGKGGYKAQVPNCHIKCQIF